MDKTERCTLKQIAVLFVMKYISHNEEYIIVYLIYLHFTQMISFKSSDELYNERCLIITIEHNHCLNKSKIPPKHSQKIIKKEWRKTSFRNILLHNQNPTTCFRLL